MLLFQSNVQSGGFGLTKSRLPERLTPMSTDHLRPALHFTPPSNWMNDPCGLVFYRGVYYLFYQHNPGANVWGDIHWGHATSRDLFSWEDRGLAIAPDTVRGMPFTGSCVVTPAGEIAALFTGALPGESGVGSFQEQCLATTCDGETWQHEGVVIANPGRADFRDPKVGRHPQTGEWYLVLAAGDEVIFYSSIDLRRWRPESSFGRGMGYNEGEWECPDLFRLPHPDPDRGEDVWVLVVHEGRGLSPHHAGAQYILGTFDGHRFVPVDEDFRPVDGGHDFYAAQTWSNTDDRTVWIAWAAHWTLADEPTAADWSGVFTLPREVRLVPDKAAGSGLRLAQSPVREIADLPATPVEELPVLGSALAVEKVPAPSPGNGGSYGSGDSPGPGASPDSDAASDSGATLASGTSLSARLYRPARGAAVRIHLTAGADEGPPPRGAGAPVAAVVLFFGTAARVEVTWTGQELTIDRRECLPGSGEPVASRVPGQETTSGPSSISASTDAVLVNGWDARKMWQLPTDPDSSAGLDIFFDRVIMEIFAAGGAAVTTDLIFPPEPLSAVEVRLSPAVTVTVDQLPETMARS
jgi:sucrose-6-phosphate hydrolase SacC (GH32 family)